MKYIDSSTTVYILTPGIYAFSDFNLMIISLLPIYIKIDITIEDIRLRSNVNNNKTNRFTKNSGSFPLFPPEHIISPQSKL